ncbi:unnamed protein product [Clavelina lepadiformis]|uniref:Peptidase S1 domain-containing protein n=1 Tax=Clavelina lepadiformis TaxID=159417 RepID=A0ABP0EWR2_CLALP
MNKIGCIESLKRTSALWTVRNSKNEGRSMIILRFVFLAVVVAAIEDGAQPKSNERQKTRLSLLSAFVEKLDLLSPENDDGNSAGIAEFPWHVTLWKGDNFICGGVLVKPSRVVTAAHCLKEFIYFVNGYRRRTYGTWRRGRICMNGFNYSVRVGKYDSSNLGTYREHLGRGELYAVTQALVPPSYRKIRNYYVDDFAVLYLERPADASIGVISVWSDTWISSFRWLNDFNSFSHVLPRNCIAIGHGGSAEFPYIPSKKLMKVDVEVKKCNHESNHRDHIRCVKTRNNGRVVGCVGDSGSPILCPIDPDTASPPYFVMGIISTNEQYDCLSNNYTVVSRLDEHFKVESLELNDSRTVNCFAKRSK